MVAFDQVSLKKLFLFYFREFVFLLRISTALWVGKPRFQSKSNDDLVTLDDNSALSMVAFDQVSLNNFFYFTSESLCFFLKNFYSFCRFLCGIFVTWDSLWSESGYLYFLGIPLDENISYKLHISTLKVKTARNLNNLFKLKDTSPKPILQLLSFSLIICFLLSYYMDIYIPVTLFFCLFFYL